MNHSPHAFTGRSELDHSSTDTRASENSAALLNQSAGRAHGAEPSRSSPWGPFAVLMGACGIVATAHYLGAQWLSDQALGLPVGAWCALLAGAWAKMVQTPTRRAWFVDRPVLERQRPTATPWPRNAVASAALDATAHVTAGGARLLDEFSSSVGRDSPSERLAATHDQSSWPTRPLRVGLDVPEDVASPLVSAPGSTPVEFVLLDESPDSTVCERHALDAVVQRNEGRLTIRTAARYGRDAAWFDWSGQRPLSYSSVFPLRIDPDRVSMGETMDAESAPMARALIEAAAALSRMPQRLNLLDRLRGRRPVVADAAVGEGTVDADEIHVDLTLRSLACAMSCAPFGDSSSANVKSAARAVSAWLATRGGWIDENDRVRMMESAARIAGDEPEVLLRLAATQISAFRDGAGIDALLRAQHGLVRSQVLQGADHVSFVQSELEHGPYGPMTLGRVAAGLCLVCATSPEEKLPYLRDDLLEDMRYSGWLVGADPDRALLMEIFRALARERQGGFALKAA